MKRSIWFVRWLPPLPVAVSAVASGVLLALAFPPASLGLVVFVAMVPLIVALYRSTYEPRVFFRAGYLFGNTFWLIHMWWIVKLIPTASITIPWLMLPALILISLYLSVYPGLAFYVLARLALRSRVAIVLTGPALWGLLEMARSGSEFGFPWGTIGNVLAPYPVLIQSASIVGLFGIGIFIVLVNFVWGQVSLTRDLRAKIAFFVAGAALVGIAAIHGQVSISRFDQREAGDPVTIAIAQPNVDLRLKWEPAFRDSTFRLIERICRDADATGASIVIFPETSAPVYLRFLPNYLNQFSRLASELDLGIFIGFLDGRYEGPNDSLLVFNSSALFDKQGVYRQYDKTHLLPFGESIPYAWKFPVLSKFDLGQANFYPGPARPPTPSRVGALGPMICFEATFPGIARDHSRRGAELLVTITNDGWFGDSPGPYQHNEMTILRTVENRKYLVRSSNTGVSMIVDPVGRVTHQLGLFVDGLVVGPVRPMNEMTLYTRFGDRPVRIAALLMIVIGAVIARLRPPPSNRSFL